MSAKIINELNEYGCDTAEAVARFLNNEELYVKFLLKFLDDPSYSDYLAAAASGDNEEILKGIHTVKGVAGNLGFTPLYKTASYMVEKYRGGEPEEAAKCHDDVITQYNDICEIIKRNL